jgi:hypothetical protein
MSDERVRLGFLLFYYWWRYVALTIFTGMGYKVGCLSSVPFADFPDSPDSRH